MSGRQGGKVKPLKVGPSPAHAPSVSPFSACPQAPKKDKKELDEDDVAFKEKKKQEEAALKAARDKGASVRPLECGSFSLGRHAPCSFQGCVCFCCSSTWPLCSFTVIDGNAGGAPGGGIKKYVSPVP